MAERDVGAEATGSGGKTQRVRQRDAEVLSAATELFHKHGYEGTSVEDIAQALGILKGSLYYYISSKEDLLFRIVSEVHADVQRILDDALGLLDLSPLSRVALYVRNQALYNVRNVTRIAVYYRELSRLSEERQAMIRAQRRNQHKAVADVLAEAQAGGEIDRDVDIGLASHYMFATVNWLHTWWRPGSVSESALAESCVKFVLTGLPGLEAPVATSTES